MLQETTNQNAKRRQRTIDTQSPALVTQCLTATSITSSTSDQPGNKGIAFCSCETVCGNASLPLGNMSRFGDRTGHIEKCVVLEEFSTTHPWGCSTHRRCFDGARKFSRKCRKLAALAVTVPWCSPSQLCGEMTETTPHTAHRGGKTTRLGDITRASWNQWPEFCLVTEPERLKWAKTDIIHSLYVCNWLNNSNSSKKTTSTFTGYCSVFTPCASFE